MLAYIRKAIPSNSQQMKVQHATDDALTDELAAQLCIEQFGLETFARADNAIRANKASRYALPPPEKHRSE